MSEHLRWSAWEQQFAAFLLRTNAAGDAAHDLEHIHRVVANAVALAAAEQAELGIVLPAAWLHDCIHIPKDSPQRARASTLASHAAVDFLQQIGYPAEYLPAIQHAIAAHSFSANIPPATPEAMVVQDADRLDALGAIGIARCVMLSGALGRRLYDPAEPFPHSRPLDDNLNTLDHFYTKLLRLAEQMQTTSGREEARRRTMFMQSFLAELGHELKLTPPTGMEV
jgi:uncharacterized protein